MEDILRLPIWCYCMFVMGACIGSYLNVVIYRWAARRSLCHGARAVVLPDLQK